MSFKRKQQEKTNFQPKKSKTIPEPVVGLEAKVKKTVPFRHGRGKGLMTSHVPVTEKPIVLLREHSKYTLEQLSSIIIADDYEDLSNHTTEAIREIGIFSIAQVTMSVHFLLSILSPCLATNTFCLHAMLIMKGLIGRCLNHEMTLDCIRVKARSTEDELNKLRA